MPLGPWRILFILLNQVGQGTYQRAFYFSRTLARRGHAVTLMAVSPHARWQLRERLVEGVQLVETPDWLTGALRSGWDAWDTVRRLGWMRGRAFDIVHAVESRPVVLAPALYAKWQGTCLIMDWCDWFGRGGSVEERPPWQRALLRPVETFFEERFRLRADGTLVITPFLRDRALAFGVRPETIAVIRNGCDTDVQPLEQSAARQLVGLSEAGPLIGYVGSCYPRDAELMAAALNRVTQSLPTARLLLIGYFNRAIESMLYNPLSVIRTGRVTHTQLFQYLAACNVCWLPLCDNGANQGRWPGKLNDYMAAARPTLATQVGELATLIPHYQLGQVAPAVPDDFAAQTIQLLMNADRQKALGLAARHAAETEMSWSRMTDELENFYDRTLAALR